MPDPLVAAFDLGTTGVRFAVFDAQARPVAWAYREIPLAYPQPGWVEQDPAGMLDAALAVGREALAHGAVQAHRIAALGITNQRETVVIWDPKSGRPLAPAIVWQDRRTTLFCAQLRKEGQEKDILARTGLPLDPYFSATKLRWLVDHVPGLRAKAEKGQALCGTVDSWILWNLCRTHATDPSNASRTQLFNIGSLEWDATLLETFAVPRPWLPQVRPSLGRFGSLSKEVLGISAPVTAVLGDQQAALFGQLGLEVGQGKVTWGTGAFLLMNVGASPVSSRHGLLSTVAYTRDGEVRYAVEGSVFVAGAALQWLRDGLGIIENTADSEALARSLSGNDGVYFVPALTGLGAPYWDPAARGTLVGITRGTTRAHLVRAALEAIAYQTHDVVRAMEADAGWELTELRVDGGAARNGFLCQFQADLLGIPVVRPRVLETTVLGAALAAGWAAGVWPEPSQLRALWQEDKRYTPQMEEARRQELLAGWKDAVGRALTGEAGGVDRGAPPRIISTRRA